MARGNIKVGDEVAVIAVVRGRVTSDRISVNIPSYGFPHSVVDSASKAVIGQHMELTGHVTRIDGDKVTISLRPRVTVDVEHVRLVQSYVAPKRKKQLIDKA
jgi:preprotein translocase subunit YajC